MGDQIVSAKIDIDPELIPGARNAVRVCLQLKPTERVTIITDEATADIAAALRLEVEQIGSECSLFTLEHHARRPLKFMPEIILEDLAMSQVSIFAAQTKNCWKNFVPISIPTKTAIASVSLPSVPTPLALMSSATFCRMKKSPASTSPSATPIPSTPAPIGFLKRISTASAATSISGSITNK